MNTQSSLNPVKCFKALADETRLRLLNIAGNYELNVNEIVETMDMGQSRISRHLKILTESGLLMARRNGLWTFYSASSEGAAGLLLKTFADIFHLQETYGRDLERAQAVREERGLESQRFFNAIAGNWGTLKKELLGDSGLDEHIIERMSDCDTVVDLGCGNGDLLPFLMKKADRVIGVDRSAQMLQEARNRFAAEPAEASIELRLGELEHLPLREAEADCAVFNMALHHLLDPAQGLAEAARVLKPSGLLLIMDLFAHQDETLRTRFGDRRLGFDPEILTQTLHQQGFALEDKTEIPLKNGLKAFLIKALKKGM
jgi:ArsR family transcriptional regulator